MSDRVDDSSADPQISDEKSLPPALKSDTRVLLAWHRSHLANERTFLSWSRTSIALLAFGFLIEKFEIFMRSLKTANLNAPDPGPSPEILCLSIGSFVAAGLLILLAGVRFTHVRRHINLGEPTFSIVPDLLIGLAFLAIAISSIVLIVIRIPVMGEMF